MNEMMQFAIYSRKSKFTGKGESIGNQVELCRQYLASHYGGEVAEAAYEYEDEGFSGGNLERPQFKQMMQDAKEKKFVAVVCYRLDRISRNIGDFANLIEELNELNISFISIKEQFDTSSPMGRAMMYIASVFSQLERETIAERIRDNMHELSKTGRWLGGTTPTGYRSEEVSTVTIQGKEKKAFKLALIPEEAELVKKIFNEFLNSGSLTKTETFLVQNGYKTKYGKEFRRYTIKGILSNPVYMIADKVAYAYLCERKMDLFAQESDFDGKHGVLAYNRTIQKHGKPHQIRDEEDWIVAIGKHEGIIPGEEWVQVQRMLTRNKSKSYRRTRSNVALLTGVLFCGRCGSYMRPKLSSRFNEQGEQIYSYLCEMKEKSRMHCCAMKNVNGNILDRMVMAELKKMGEDDSEFLRRLKEGQKILKENSPKYEIDAARLDKEQQKLEEEIQGLVESLGKAEGTAAQRYILSRIDSLHDEKEKLMVRIKELKDASAGNEISEYEFDVVRQLLFNFRDTIDTMGIEQKREAIRTFVKRVVWDGENIHVYLFGSDDGEETLRGINAPIAQPEDETEVETEGEKPLSRNSK